jgi:hypothetical protein
MRDHSLPVKRKYQNPNDKVENKKRKDGDYNKGPYVDGDEKGLQLGVHGKKARNQYKM